MNENTQTTPAAEAEDKAFYDWLRSNKANGRLTKAEVEMANELMGEHSPHVLQSFLASINGWYVPAPIAPNQNADAVNGRHIPTFKKMTLSENGVNLIKQFESFRSKPYLDTAGVWTIGYGSTYYLNGKRVNSVDKPITEAEAAKLKQDIINRDFVPAVNLAIAPALEKGIVTQNMFDAMVSLAYNIGVGGFAKSTVVKELNAGNLQKASAAFNMWVNAGGKPSKGLMNRRKQEAELFLA